MSGIKLHVALNRASHIVTFCEQIQLVDSVVHCWLWKIRVFHYGDSQTSPSTHYDSTLMCNLVLWFNSIFFTAGLFISMVGASRQQTLIKEWKGQRKKHTSTGFIHTFLYFICRQTSAHKKKVHSDKTPTWRLSFTVGFSIKTDTKRKRLKSAFNNSPWKALPQ